MVLQRLFPLLLRRTPARQQRRPTILVDLPITHQPFQTNRLPKPNLSIPPNHGRRPLRLPPTRRRPLHHLPRHATLPPHNLQRNANLLPCHQQRHNLASCEPSPNRNVPVTHAPAGPSPCPTNRHRQSRTAIPLSCRNGPIRHIWPQQHQPNLASTHHAISYSV